MNNIVLKKQYKSEQIYDVNEREIWRYAGYKGIPDEDDKELLDLLSTALSETKGSLEYKVCYYSCSIDWKDGMPILPFDCHSKNLSTCLDKCDEIVMFCASIGMPYDRFIARYERTNPAKGLILQAYGAERVEALCDTFCDEIKNEVKTRGRICTPRFSPGYGDLDLSMQKDFFRILDCTRQIGVFLNDSLLMTPSKSVTAIFGIRGE